MLRQWSTWVVLVLLSAGAVVYSVANFDEAVPITNVDLEMNRAAALDSARAQAQRLGLGPEGFSQAALFWSDGTVQTFAELEVSRDAYRRMIRAGTYQPYQWRVRHYAPDSARETVFAYAPDGTPYGFREEWPESAPGPALPTDSARHIAEARATSVWNVDLSLYDLVSTSRNEHSSGRVDHTFLYQRPEKTLGEKGRYRLRLRISGDQLSMVKHFVKVPQGFKRRYTDMRSANATISQAGTYAYRLLYVLGGCILGLYWLFRRGAVKWRTAVVWGGIITTLLFLSGLNRLPLAWMNYDTAIGTEAFIWDQVVSHLTGAVGTGIKITLAFVAAEGLSRMAFGDHPRLWKLWTPEAASSTPILNRTLIGYLLVAVFFAYDVALYKHAQDLLGWWRPSTTLFNPNILAHEAPWLSPVTSALRAGFWEECLFRAVPLAGAALIGDYLGKRTWWIGGAMLIQAVIFGAGHAGYATQPAYARLVELILPSIGFGLLYLALGLLPAILVHYGFNTVWMAQPLFVSEAPGAWVSQAAVVASTLVPLLAIAYGYFRSRTWAQKLPERFYNRSWSPSPDTDASGPALPVTTGLSRRVAIGSTVAGLLGVGLWVGGTGFTTYETELSASRSEAEQVARAELKAIGGDPENWMMGSEAETLKGQEDRFVWREGGPSAYRQLMGSYLDAPFWKVRFYTFADSVAVEDRAEEYVAHWGPEWGLREIVHRKPRDVPGDSLAEPQARAVADSVIQAQLDLNPDRLKRIKARPKPRPNRRDWTFMYADTTRYPLDKGQARIKVVLTGGGLKDISEFVHVPESWERETRGERKAVQTLQSAMDALIGAFAAAGLLLLLVWWARGPFYTWTFAGLSVFMFLMGAADLANRWPDMLADLDTAEPYLNQVAFDVIGPLVGLVFTAGVVGLGAGVLHARVGRSQPSPLWHSVAGGVGLGLLGKGALALSRRAGPSLFPPWSSYDSLSMAIPWLDPVLDRVPPLIGYTLGLLLAAVTVHRWTSAGRTHRWYMAGAALVLGFVVAGAGNPNTLGVWALYGTVLSVLLGGGYLMVVRHDRATIPMIGATVMGLDAVEAMVQAAYPAALVGEALALVIILSLGIGWSYLLCQRQARQANRQADQPGGAGDTATAK